ncbi:Peroxidasin [Dufourea novaeangliae]|uniref:Peroxidasin n=1 Tax=Dufourea novaeangliae TaxID=178035 RepID=A0A154PPW0_DUFNO|nr:Peroxidasin [Dufourea novaeangliae]
MIALIAFDAFCFRHSLALLSIVVLVALAITTTNDQFDISDYLYGVDHDLQARARAGIEAERFTYQTKARFQNRPEVGDAPCRIKPDRPCPPSKYRTPSGVCNNVRHPVWGSRGAPFLKVLPPDYSDGVAAPRQSQTGSVLPTPTEVVQTIIRHLDPEPDAHEGLTSFSGVWSELVLQDIARMVHPAGQPSLCCSTKARHPECYEVRDEQNGGCKSYWRSVSSLTVHRCNFEGREQMNGASSYLDGSDIYGTTDERLHRLRTYIRGRVDVSICEVCKSTENKALGTMYTALLSEHNRVAARLAEANELWNDAKLFHEARRIVIAQMQHITLNEYLPSILGEGARTDPRLMPVASGFYGGYSSSNVGGTYDAVALAALRALTSLRKHRMDNATRLEDHVIASANRIRLESGPSSFDSWLDTDVHFVHVARDHGVPGYVRFVADCSGNNVTVQNFKDLEQFMRPTHGKLLQSIYSQVEDIDLLVGGILEIPNKGAAIGPTFECLLKKQFVKIRNSDRFWYENDLPPSGVSPAQLAEIRKVSLAGILCANTDIQKIQPKAFIQQDPYLNARINCDQHSVLDVTPWGEEPLPEPIKESVSSKPVTSELIPNFNPNLLAAAVKKAEADLIERKQLEYNSWLEQRIADPKSPAGTAASFSKANRDALLLANSSIMYELATNEILNGIHGLRRRKRQVFDTTDNVLGFPNNDFSDLLQNVDISGFLSQNKPTNHDEVECPVDDSPCDPTTPYRTLSGHCNNLRNPSLGKSLTTFARLLPPIYEDGVSKPRITATTGGLLPNPRVVSAVIHPDISNLHNRYTLMVMQFAQFLDHDLTMTPIHKGFAESIPSCRPCDSPRTVHPECNPFPVPPGDHYYPTVNVSSGARMCFPSMRSLPGQQHLGPREQINQNTGYLDASVIYGENTCICNVLRGFNGRMNVTQSPHRGARDLLPQSATHPECKAKSGFCFIGGDGRASEQPGLTVMHTFWIREHNRIVESLRQVNPHWDGEKLFQQSRRIISAMLQHITYNEFLPRILGWNAVTLYGLKLLPQGYYKEYSPTCNPSILTEFATAAYRIGHSLLRPHLPRMDRNYQNIEPSILLRDGFFDPDPLYRQNMLDEMIRGLVATPMETLDQFITGEVTNHLFEIKGIPYSGIDLIALNVHRARDHGIPSYNNYRALCNLKRATTFEDLSREMAPEVIARMKRIYASVDDIDLFPGGMSERPLQGGLVGPTFACIIAIQFRQARKCDRFWYETDDPNIRFTEHQLAEIRKATLSKVMCDNMDEHNDMQRAAFDLPSNFLNPRVPCSSMPQMDLSAWRETRHGCQIGGRNVALGESGFPTPCTSCVCTAEGTQCASLRITDCNQLLREASREAILRDDVCTAQCGFVLAATEATSRLQQFTTSTSFPGFAGHRNSLRSVSTPVSFNGFKLPDLSQFIG